MQAYIIRRLAALVLTLLFISLIVFVVMRVIPGDPAVIILGTEATEANLKELRHRLGLDRPLLEQYFDWLKGALTGDFQVSLHYNTPVSTLISSRLAVTGPLALLAILLTTILSIPFGIYAATHHNRVGDYGAMIVSQLGISIPEFWLGILLILLFAVSLHWFSAGGFTSWSVSPLGALKSLLLPALALAVVRAAIVARMTRSSLLEILGEEYVQVARSKGLAERVVIYKHALRNSLITIITVIGLQLGQLLAGAIIIENVFVLPGLGAMVLHGIFQRDLPVIQGVVLFMAGIIVFTNFLVDILYGFLDPRVRYE